MNTIVNRQAHLDPREYYPYIPEWLVGVVQKATELEPEARYQSCEEFLKALEHEGGIGTGEHRYWSGRVASAAAVRPVSSAVSHSTPAPTNPENSCPKCGVPVEKEMEFCGKCGSDLQQECPGCKRRIRWHHEHCPKCGVNIENKKAEIAAEAERKRLEAERIREEVRIAEEKWKEEEARVNREKMEARRRREEARLAEKREREEEEKRQEEEIRRKEEERLNAIKARSKRRKQWWRSNGWKVLAGVVLVGLCTWYLLYRSSDQYAYQHAEWLYNSGDIEGASSAFRALRGYRDSRNRAVEIRFMKVDEVITDQVTWLEWRVGPDSSTNWIAAGDWVNSLGDGWHMPTRAELQGLWDSGISRDNWGPFENSGYRVWSGEFRDSLSAWTFDFSVGCAAWGSLSPSVYGSAFSVRPQ